MTGCSAVGCSNRSEQGFKMKVFPKDPVRRAQWVAKVRRLNWEPNHKCSLCEVHFEKDQWEKRADGRRKLKPFAIPTLFQYTQTQTKRRLPDYINSNLNKTSKVSDTYPLGETRKVNSETTVTEVSNSEATVNSEIIAKEDNNSEVAKLDTELLKARKIIAQVTENIQNEKRIFPVDTNLRVSSTYQLTGTRKTNSDDIVIEKINSKDTITGKDNSEVAINMETNSKLIKLNEELQKSKKVITCLHNENIRMKYKLRERTIENFQYRKKLKKYSPNYLKEIFNDDQIKCMKHKSMAFTQWSSETIEIARHLLISCGTKGYKALLHLQLPYPSIRTLQRSMRKEKEKARPIVVNLCQTVAQ